MTPRKKNPKLLEARERLLKDFTFWAKNCWKIRTKDGDVVPFILNGVQERFLRENVIPQMEQNGYVRSVILKGRQQGMSTLVASYIYWHTSQRKGQKAFVIAHVAESTDTLFDMYKYGHDTVPEAVRPATKYSSKKELVFDGFRSGIQVATAGGKGIGRGETLQCMHLSEVAFWPTKFAKANFNGLIKCVPKQKGNGTCCFVESTAQGMGNQFHSLWEGAVRGENDFWPFFSAWFESQEYRQDPPESFQRTPAEDELAELYNLDDAQLYWRRLEIARDGLDHFKQEYPCCAEEAFLTSGRPVFIQERIQEMLAEAPAEPLRTMAVEQAVNDNGKVIWRLQENPRGELAVYLEHDPKETYVIGADVSVGIRDRERSDYCVAQVLDSKKRQVAVWRGQVTPDYYAHVLTTLGYHYNLAMIAPERNGHGILVCVRIWKDQLYPNVFTDVKEGHADGDHDTLDIGFQTNTSSKPLIIDKLRGDVRTGGITIYDRTTLQEMLSFISTDSGKMQAEEGCNDDCVLALAIANHIHEGTFTPVDVTDDYYVEAI
jgi:hypothetical protein